MSVDKSAFVTLHSSLISPALHRSKFLSSSHQWLQRPTNSRLHRCYAPSVIHVSSSLIVHAPRRMKSMSFTLGAALISFFPSSAHGVYTASGSSTTQFIYPQVAKVTFSKKKFRGTTAVVLISQDASNENSSRSKRQFFAAEMSTFRRTIPNASDTLVNKILKSALLCGIVTLIIIAATIIVFWMIQDSLVYKPTRVWRGKPSSFEMPFYEDVNYCTVDGAEISGWLIKQPPKTFATSRTLIYFHGTDKNASFRLRKVSGLYLKCKCNILLLSYRGYGLSTGKPNERGVRIDAESAYDYLQSRGDIDVGPRGNLWVYGESLGGAVAVHFSNVYQHCINALILENTFTSLLDMIRLEFPILGVFRYLSRNRWQSKKIIKNLTIPLLFLSGLKDSYIPPAMMRQMHALATESKHKEFVEFEDGTHNRTWAADGFYESVASFMDRVDAKTRHNVASASQSSSTEDNSRLRSA